MDRARNRWCRLAFAGVVSGTALLLAGPVPAAAQVVGMERLVTEDGVRLDFARDGVWRRKGARVIRYRNRLKAQALFDALNAAVRGGAAAQAASVLGTLRLPTVLFAFNDSPISTLPAASRYDSIFYSDPPLAGRPYTVRTLYEEISNGLLSVDGRAFGWVRLTDSATYYLDACGSANPLDCPKGRDRFGDAFREALAALVDSVDFSPYDNDGDDNVPNSGDDDGVVDVVQFVQPVLGGECSGPGIWAHKFSLSDIGGVYATNDGVTVDSYYVVSGVGGTNCRATDEIMAIGVSAHELGHGLGLPDLYDTGGATSGIGEWGLMGTGLYTSLPSPAHYSAWSKEQMGWVTVREIDAAGSYTVGPVGTSDTVFMFRPRPQADNSRGEYFLLENKQAVGADTANVLSGGATGPKNGGLLMWHVDSAQVYQGWLSNTVNAGAIHGVALIEADGQGALRSGSDRGDSGDVYPGSTMNTKLSVSTVPAPLKNSDGLFVGFQIDSIEQVVPNGEMRFHVAFGNPAIVRASDMRATITVDGVEYLRFDAVFELARGYEIGMTDVQLTQDSRTEFTFQSWSDGGARTHTVTDPLAGDSIVAQVTTRHRILATVVGQGSVAAVLGIDVEAGALVIDGSTVTLAAEPGPGLAFDNWSGDTTAVGDTLVLRMDRPFDVTATFYPVVAFLDSALTPGIMGANYSAGIRGSGGVGSGTYVVQIVAGSLPAGLEFRPTVDGGEVVGVPQETGLFDVSLSISSGNLSATQDFQLRVSAPVLEVDRLVDQLLDEVQLLTPDELRYLDLLGNRNDGFDVGDFLAWIDAGNGDTADAMTLLRTPRKSPRGRR